MYKSTGGNGLSTAYTYDGTQLIHESKINSGKKYEVWYQYDADGSPIGVEIDGASYLYLKNAQNDIIGLVDENGTVVARYVYNAWGEVLSVTDQNGQEVTSKTHVANLNGLRYRGYYYDVDLGWYYLNTRYYDPLAKRYLNADSLNAVVASLDSFYDNNLYAYCDNNPIIRKDRNGDLWDIIFDVISLATSIADVISNPSDPTAWAGLAADVICSVVPGLTGGGSLVKALAKLDDITDSLNAAKKVDKVVDTVKTTKKLHRPYIRKSTRQAVEAAARRAPDGRFLDANTRKIINGKYDLGHKYGHEFWYERDQAMAKGWSQKQFNDYMNNPDFYQIEDPFLNRSHRFEKRW